jgi:membrane protein DedA with SNARE-associated domain
LGALVATSAGILNFSFKKFFFYSIFATLLWNSFWATLVYFIGDKALDLVGLRFLLLVIFAWIVYRIWKPQKEDERDIDVPTP